MQELESDPFYRSINDERIAISNEDKAVLKHLQETVREIKLENEETHLKFQFRWSVNPAEMKNNYEQAKGALLRVKKELSSKPELKKKYCEKIELAIAAGHIVKLSNKGDSNPGHKYLTSAF